jgi:GntR family transcriptional regulator, transcriptional repressor for pyruvate dehydrogenase complex
MASNQSPIPRPDPEPGRPAMTVGHLQLAPEKRRALKTSERVALDIVRDIVALGLRSGDRLPLEAAMVEQYGVSRSSLREALRLLEVQGLIHLKPGPGGGTVVGSVEPSHLARTASLYFHLGAATYNQVMATQVMLEPICAFLAAQHPDRAEAMAPFVESIPLGSVPEYRTVTNGFHGAVYRLAGNDVLTLLTQAVTHIVTHHVVATMDPVELRESILDEHMELARAIATGEAERARDMMAEHFQRQHDYYRVHNPERLAELIEWR